jgi:hypothetical protein
MCRARLIDPGYKYIFHLGFFAVMPALFRRHFVTACITLVCIQQAIMLARRIMRPAGRVCWPHSSP